jgi:hypothetical protein
MVSFCHLVCILHPFLSLPADTRKYRQWFCRISATASYYGEHIFQLQHHRHSQTQSGANHPSFIVYPHSPRIPCFTSSASRSSTSRRTRLCQPWSRTGGLAPFGHLCCVVLYCLGRGFDRSCNRGRLVITSAPLHADQARDVDEAPHINRRQACASTYYINESWVERARLFFLRERTPSRRGSQMRHLHEAAWA